MSDKCSYCGATLAEGMNYCPQCGHAQHVKKFYRSDRDSKILGLCGGLGEYFNIDANLVRVIVALIILWTGIVPGLIIYFLLGIFIPVNPEHRPED